MANINIRGLSDHTKESLRVRAAQAGMSLEAFARKALQDALAAEDKPPQSIVNLAQKYFGSENGTDLDLPKRDTRREQVDFS